MQADLTSSPTDRVNKMMTGLQARWSTRATLFCTLIDGIGGAAAFLAKWLVLLACVISAGNAVARYLFNLSSNGWLEIQWYMFAAIVLLGAPKTLRINGHVRVDLLYSRLADRTRLWIDILGICLFLLPAMAYLAYLAWPFFVSSFVSHERSSNAGGLILWPVKLVLPLGFALVWLQGLSELLKRAIALAGIIQLDTHYEAPLQ
jgi:TRAP-type mannitol/chloroaromatic compound transport system permease small subunit